VPAAFVPIRLPWIVSPPLLIDMPRAALPEIRLPCPSASPIWTGSSLIVSMPSGLLPIAAVPVTSVPMRLPRISTPAPAPDPTWTPQPWNDDPLPEITLPAFGAVPPMTVLGATVFMGSGPGVKPPTRTPDIALLSAPVPAASVPIRLPSTRVPSESPRTWTPCGWKSGLKFNGSPLPEITFRSAAAVPPITLSSPPYTATPAPRLRSSLVAAESTPMKLPATTLSPT
jgi:hypothetical protein